MERVTREEFSKVVLNPESSFEDRKNLIIEEFEIELPEDIEDGDPFLDFVYDIYLKTYEKYQLSSRVLYRKEKKHNKERKGTIKEFIINAIMIKESIALKDLHELVDKEFNYSEVGRHPRTRCRKVIQQLLKEQKIELSAEKHITWKGGNGSNN